MIEELEEHIGRLTLHAARGVVRVPNVKWDIAVTEREIAILRSLPEGFYPVSSREVTNSLRLQDIVLTPQQVSIVLRNLHKKLGDDVLKRPFSGHFMLAPRENIG